MDNVIRFPNPESKPDAKRRADSDSKAKSRVANLEDAAREREFFEDRLALGLTNRVKERVVRNLRDSMEGISDVEYLRRLIGYYARKEAAPFMYRSRHVNLAFYREIPTHVAERVARCSMEECAELLGLLKPDEVDEPESGNVPGYVVVQKGLLALALIQRKNVLIAERFPDLAEKLAPPKKKPSGKKKDGR